jgi:hypothetical protein
MRWLLAFSANISIERIPIRPAQLSHRVRTHGRIVLSSLQHHTPVGCGKDGTSLSRAGIGVHLSVLAKRDTDLGYRIIKMLLGRRAFGYWRRLGTFKDSGLKVNGLPAVQNTTNQATTRFRKWFSSGRAALAKSRFFTFYGTAAPFSTHSRNFLPASS